jgi:hypothetical protein
VYLVGVTTIEPRGAKSSNWLEIMNLIFGSFCITWFFVRHFVYYADLSWLQGAAPAW